MAQVNISKEQKQSYRHKEQTCQGGWGCQGGGV